MIEKSVGFVRNLIKKRKEVYGLVKTVVNADNVLVINVTNDKISIVGHTDSDAMNIFMLGCAVSECHIRANENIEKGIELNEIIEQVSKVAFSRSNQ